jgi:hypothetical protein
MSEHQHVTFEVTGTRSEMDQLAEQFGGEVTREGFLRWKLTIETETARSLDEIVEWCRAQGLTVSEVQA